MKGAAINPADDTPDRVRETAEAVYRSESRRVFATLVRLLGDFDLAEEALHDAFRAALEQLTVDGIPDNPRAWLLTVAGRRLTADTPESPTVRPRQRVELPDLYSRDATGLALTPVTAPSS